MQTNLTINTKGLEKYLISKTPEKKESQEAFIESLNFKFEKDLIMLIL